MPNRYGKWYATCVIHMDSAFIAVLARLIVKLKINNLFFPLHLFCQTMVL